ncbi:MULTISPECIES: hypothetical protein [unclassified Streptomyces]|uniref:hypothetical protein n=1 Tax=unclassified Streptomyces TaxID=2593676 RepID=UPI00081E30E9|nr:MULTISPECIES: hypothetical protein [unclassified Streptomyces]MYR93394.1 hypothetical protein [Streptomyces sp. SID4937]SCD51868.1 hypothetical protein GA0115243_102558 [Streptomyces sp. ScaeMP-e83]
MITAAEVADYIGIEPPEAGSYDAFALEHVTAAVNVLVPGTVPRVRALAEGEPWPPDVITGALMLGQRLFARRRSPTGVATYTETGPAYVARWDPDLERLLRVGRWAPPGGA